MGGLRRNELIALVVVGVLSVAAGAAHFLHWTPLLAFALATGALAGLAWIVSFATEQLGERFGPAVTGLLQSTLGNLPEFFIVVFALSAGEIVVAKASIIGSIFANALLVLGLTIVVGSRVSDGGIMCFEARLPKDNATLMLLASFLIVLVGVSVASEDRASEHVEAISIIGAVAVLPTYAAWLLDYVRSDAPRESTGAPARVGLPVTIALLTAGGVGAAFVSDWFIDALSPAMAQIGVPKAFAGLVIVAIAGNAVENTAALVLASKGEADLAISVVKNSVAQVTAFLFPALVLVSLFFTTSLTFQLAPVYIGAILLTALALWQVTGDGEATMFEGVALVALYVILAVVAWYE